MDVLSAHLEVPQAALLLEQMPSAGAAAVCFWELPLAGAARYSHVQLILSV